MLKVILSILIFSIAVLLLVFNDHFSFEQIKSNRDRLQLIISDNYLFVLLFYFLLTNIVYNIPIPFAAVFKIIGGIIFGFAAGSIFNIVSTTSGGCCGFFLYRYILKDAVVCRYQERICKIDDEICENGFYHLLALRVMMVFPYFLLHMLAGISNVSFKVYFLSTFIGVISSSIIYAYVGSNISGLEKVGDILSFPFILSIILMVLVIMLPVYFKKRKNWDNNKPCV